MLFLCTVDDAYNTYGYKVQSLIRLKNRLERIQIY